MVEATKTKPNFPDSSIIKLMLNRPSFDKYRDFVRSKFSLYTRETQRILGEISKAYAQDPTIQEISLDTLRMVFMSYPNMSDKDQELYKTIFDKVQNTPDEQINIILNRLAQNSLFNSLDELRFKDSLSCEKLEELVSQYKEQSKAPSLVDLDINIEELLEEEDVSHTSWGISFLKNNIPGPGIKQFIILAAYVNTGKTAFAVGEAVSLAKTLTGDSRILWLNNEEDNKMVLLKFISSALDRPFGEVLSNKKKAVEEYINVMNGDINRIQIMDTREYTLPQVLDHLTSREWDLIVIDQIDKFDTSGKRYYNKDHERLKGVYEEFRKLAYKHGTIIAICQTDASVMGVDKKTGESYYQKYIYMNQLDGSKVGKPGAADVIITIGTEDPLLPARYLHIAKAKGPGNLAKGEAVIRFDRFKYQDEFED